MLAELLNNHVFKTKIQSLELAATSAQDGPNSLTISRSQEISIIINNNNNGLPSHRQDDLYIALKNFLIVGQLLSAVPIQGLDQNDCWALHFNWVSWQVFYNILITVLLLLSAISNLVTCFKVNGGGKSASDLAWSANMAVYYFLGAFNCHYFLRHSTRFIDLFRKWQRIRLHFAGQDKNLRRDLSLISGLIFATCFLEHAYSHLKFFPLVELAERRLINEPDLVSRLRNASSWEIYLWRSHPFLPNVIPYNLVVAVFFFIISKFAIFSWEFGDIFISVMSRAVYFKFKMLNEEAEKIIFSSPTFKHSKEKWARLAEDHANLCKLVISFEEVLSPLIFTSFGANIYYLCLQLNLGLTPSANNSTIATIYAVWSFLLLILRLLSAAIPAAQINYYAHNIVHILKRCPADCYSSEIERIERYLAMTKVGLSGLGCFVITRPFILQIVSVVFTFEIVLLQSSSSDTPCVNQRDFVTPTTSTTGHIN